MGAEAAASEGAERPFAVTAACARRLGELSKSRGPTRLRVVVESGGCSGFQYVFELEPRDEAVRPDDVLVERDGQAVVIDQVSMDFMRGATLDFESEMIRSAFTVTENPNTEVGCGCGVSFAAKGF